MDSDATKSHPQAPVQAIISIPDPQIRQIVQRAASRGIVAAVEAMDGFKYSFNNAWSAKDEDGQRFSYICQDSMQNKDRHANGFTRTQKHLKGDGERGVRKPTFDCKGNVSVKCSLNRRCIDVYYRHYAIHPTIAERRALKTQRPRRESYNTFGEEEPRDHNQIDTGGLFGKLQSEKSACSAPPRPQAQAVSQQQQASNVGRPLKRKRDSDASEGPKESGKPLSLVDLLKKSAKIESRVAPSPSPNTSTQNGARPPPVNYDLPSWQKPPTPPTAPQPPPVPKQKPPQTPQNGTQFTSPYQPYQPPYQPHQSPYPQQTQQGYLPTPPQSKQPKQPQAQQQYLGLPKHHPQSQGLFTTMKSVASDPPITHYVPVSVQSVRAKQSCTNCRYGKKKVSSRTLTTLVDVLTSCSATKQDRSAMDVRGRESSIVSTKVSNLCPAQLRSSTELHAAGAILAYASPEYALFAGAIAAVPSSTAIAGAEAGKS